MQCQGTSDAITPKVKWQMHHKYTTDDEWQEAQEPTADYYFCDKELNESGQGQTGTGRTSQARTEPSALSNPRGGGF